MAVDRCTHVRPGSLGAHDEPYKKAELPLKRADASMASNKLHLGSTSHMDGTSRLAADWLGMGRPATWRTSTSRRLDSHSAPLHTVGCSPLSSRPAANFVTVLC